MKGGKERASFTINEEVLKRAKEVASRKNIPLSRAIENFLRFFSDPWLYCFRCGKRFNVSGSDICPKCGWLKCPNCQTCGCNLGEEAHTVAFYMRMVYEDILLSRLKL